MSKFTSAAVTVNRPAAEISDKFSDLSQLQAMVDTLPEDKRASLGEVSFEPNAVVLNTAQVGAIRFEIVDRSPEIIKFKAVGAPVNVELYSLLQPIDADSTDVKVEIDLELPMMLRPLVAPHMQKAVDMLADVIANVSKK